MLDTPSALHARTMRRATAPRFAMKTLSNTALSRRPLGVLAPGFQEPAEMTAVKRRPARVTQRRHVRNDALSIGGVEGQFEHVRSRIAFVIHGLGERRCRNGSLQPPREIRVVQQRRGSLQHPP